jgi:hypothetical protein
VLEILRVLYCGVEIIIKTLFFLGKIKYLNRLIKQLIALNFIYRLFIYSINLVFIYLLLILYFSSYYYYI